MTLELITDTPTLTASEMLAISGVTYRMLDHWTRAGYLKPATKARGHGYPHRYPSDEATIALFGRELIDVGFTPARALTYARQLVEAADSTIILGDGLVKIEWTP
jgi:hypothetical protein